MSEENLSDVEAQIIDVTTSCMRTFSVILTVAAVAWFIDALAARQSYASEFYASLRQGYLDLTSPIVDFTPDQVRNAFDVFGLELLSLRLTLLGFWD